MKYEGQHVAAVQFEPPEQPLTDAELARALLLKTGSIFHERDLRQAIQNLFATGRFSDLAVDARETGDGVAIKFITKRAYFSGASSFRELRTRLIVDSLQAPRKLKIGSSYVDGDKAEAVNSLTNLLRQNGFFHAERRG